MMRNVHLALLGQQGVGKSCLVIQLTKSVFAEDYDPTIEDSYRHQMTVDDNPTMLHIIDTADCESPMLDSYIREANSHMCVYAINSRDSFNKIPALIQKIATVKDFELPSEQPPAKKGLFGKKKKPQPRESRGTSRPTILLIGNKSDKSDEREVSIEEGRNLARKYNIDFIETSAKTRENLVNAFAQAVRDIRRCD